MLTVVIQGNITKWTYKFAKRYTEFPFVSMVIISTWEGEYVFELDKSLVIKNTKPDNPGCTNRNLQIVSSYNGAKLSETPWTLKVRSDMFLPYLEDMLNFSITNWTDKVKAFVLSVYKPFPFHPRDHAFLGKTQDIVDIFNIPLCNSNLSDTDYTKTLRSEAYIGYKTYSKMINLDFININPNLFLLDDSIYKEEALQVYHAAIKEKIGFVPFPRCDIEWPKYYPGGYPFDYLAKKCGETYYEDIT